MKTKHNLKIFLGVVVLFLMVLACGPKPTEEPAATATVKEATPTVAADSSNNGGDNNAGNNSSGNDNLTQDQKSYLAHATVRIWGEQKKGNKLTPVYVGSGTIITPDGLILTNCHVANPAAMGFPADETPDALVVDLIKTEDKPPVSTYIAEVQAFDPVLDLAVIRVTKTIKGATVKPESLKLPYVKLGNSDNVKFGERLYIFGYPAIGGLTITYSTGDVAGFDSDKPVGDRAWIKTEAAISGGNSGGLASNTKGEIIGVPTQIGTGTGMGAVDCRRIADTNGDGVIDDKDTCIPAGGFINGVRPVNWALPLIKAAKSGSEYASPYPNPLEQANNDQPQPTAEPNTQPSGSPKLAFSTWAENEDNNHCPVNELKTYPSGATQILAFFQYSGFSEGDSISYSWILNGKDVADNTEQWKGNGDGDCFAFTLANAGDALPDGDYSLKVFTGKPAKVIGKADTTIGGDGSSGNGGDNNGGNNGDNGGGNSGGDVTLKGTVTDANSGRGIKGIYVVVLKPGIDPMEWVKSPQASDGYSMAETGSDGSFEIPDPLGRGKTYGIVAGNNSLGYPSETGTLQIKANTADVINLPIQLSK
jgi:serine protease Do